MASIGVFHPQIRYQSSSNAFTLVELMVTLIIISLLLLVSLPLYNQQRLQSQRQVAVSHLLQLRIRQEHYFNEHHVLATDLEALGVPQNLLAIDRRGRPVKSSSHERIYRIELRARNRDYELLAIPQLAQQADTRCGTLTLNRLGIVSASGSAAAGDCW